MKKRLIILAVVGAVLISAPVPAQTGMADGQLSNGVDFQDVLRNLFSENGLFAPKSNYAWADYQLFSNRGERPDYTKTLIPMTALNYERGIWQSLGFRSSVSTHWWQEDKVLAATYSEKFRETFTYRYFVFGSGLSWHLKLNEKWDPFVGFMTSFRWVNASCNCATENTTRFSTDFYLGTRYFLKERLFFVGELGQHENGYLKLGLGIKIN